MSNDSLFFKIFSVKDPAILTMAMEEFFRSLETPNSTALIQGSPQLVLQTAGGGSVTYVTLVTYRIYNYKDKLPDGGKADKAGVDEMSVFIEPEAIVEVAENAEAPDTEIPAGATEEDEAVTVDGPKKGRPKKSEDPEADFYIPKTLKHNLNPSRG